MTSPWLRPSRIPASYEGTSRVTAPGVSFAPVHALGKRTSRFLRVLWHRCAADDRGWRKDKQELWSHHRLHTETGGGSGPHLRVRSV
jgi:hypothetical protein